MYHAKTIDIMYHLSLDWFVRKTEQIYHAPTIFDRIFLSSLSGCLLVFCSPGFALPWLAWIALMPLFVALRCVQSKISFSLGLLCGLIFIMGSFFWINQASGVTWYDYVFLSSYLAIYFGLFGAFFIFLTDQQRIPLILIAPSLWVAVEYARSEAGFLALPMAKLGHSQYLNTSLIQIAELAGDYGVSFVIVFVNATILILLTKPKKLYYYLIFLVLAIAVPLTYGHRKNSVSTNDETLSIAVIQGNIQPGLIIQPQLELEYFEKHADLSREVAKKDPKPKLIVWPEGAVSSYFINDPRANNQISRLAKFVDAFMIIGSSNRTKFSTNDGVKITKPLNTAYFISSTGKIVDSYNKMRLVPFAEYLPMSEIIPWSTRLNSSTSNYFPGNKYSLFNIENKKIGVIICWEALFSNIAREFTNKGAHVLINIGDEAWFGETNAPYQMLAATVFRAVENHIAIARSINTGISGFIDASGRVLNTVNYSGRELFVAGYSQENLPFLKKKTFYTVNGNVFVYLNIVLLVCIFCYRIFNRLNIVVEANKNL